MFECPVCNGMENLLSKCPDCDDGTIMDDLGPVDNYYGPYSPYQEQSEDLTSGREDDSCAHLCRCPECSSEHTVSVDDSR